MNELEGSQPQQRLFRVWHTVLEMLHDRGYIVDPRLLLYTQEQWAAQCPARTDMTLHLLHGERRERQLRVIFVDREAVGPAAVVDGKVRKQSVGELMKRLGDREGTHGLFVFADDLTLTPPARTVMRAINDESPGILQWFFEEELVVNIVHQNYGKSPRFQHPLRGKVPNVGLIYEDDPVARHYNAQSGQTLRIVRRSETGGLAVNVRRCVAPAEHTDQSVRVIEAVTAIFMYRIKEAAKRGKRDISFCKKFSDAIPPESACEYRLSDTEFAEVRRRLAFAEFRVVAVDKHNFTVVIPPP